MRGISIGKNADTPLERAADDYVECLRTLYAHADYFAINVSSPNTPRLRELQAGDALAGIVSALQAERHGSQRDTAPAAAAAQDFAGPRIRANSTALCAQLRDLGLDGVIAGNTTYSSRASKACCRSIRAAD